MRLFQECRRDVIAAEGGFWFQRDGIPRSIQDRVSHESEGCHS